MSEPYGFSWVDEPLLAALAKPSSPEELAWLRAQGIELLISLTEDPPPRRWVNDAGLFLVHVPVEDFSAPTQDQVEQAITAILRAHEQQRGAAVHCAAGLGRTGTILAAYFIYKGDSAGAAIERVRSLRPGSIETEEQEEVLHAYARRLRAR